MNRKYKKFTKSRNKTCTDCGYIEYNRKGYMELRVTPIQMINSKLISFSYAMLNAKNDILLCLLSYFKVTMKNKVTHPNKASI